MASDVGEVTGATDDARAGRPRDPGRDAAILAATLDLLGEVGYEQVTVRAIAQRAGAGLATLYRRWPTKEHLVVEAVGSYADATVDPVPGEGPRQALVRLVGGLVDTLQGDRRGLVPNVVGQLSQNAALAEALRERIVGPRLAALRVQLAALTGLPPERVATAAELIPAWLCFRSLFLGDHIAEADVHHAVDTAVAAALGAG